MSINPLSSSVSSLFANQQNSMQQNLRALTQALQAGNTSTAQQAYTNLTQNMPKHNAAAGQSNPLHEAFSNIGTALKSGNLSSAKAAMEAFQKNLSVQRRREPSPQPIAAPAPSQNTIPSADDGSSDTSGPTFVTGPVRVVRLEA